MKLYITERGYSSREFRFRVGLVEAMISTGKKSSDIPCVHDWKGCSEAEPQNYHYHRTNLDDRSQ